MTTYTLYFLFEEDTGNVFYVGITQRTLKARLNQHRWDSITRVRDTGLFRHVHHTANKLRKMRKQNRSVGIEALLCFPTSEQVWEAEKKYIEWAKGIGLRLTNNTKGGDGCVGYKLSASQRAHRSKINSGSGNPQFGKSPSLETRAKQRAALLGKPNPGLLDPAKKKVWRAKIVASHADVSGSKNPMFGKSGALAPTSKVVEQRTLNGSLVAIYGSTREASRLTGISCTTISACASGKTSTGCGFAWCYPTQKKEHQPD